MEDKVLWKVFLSDNFIKDPTKGIANTGQMNYLKKQANKQTNKPSPPEQLKVETTRRDPNSVLCQAVNTLCNVLDIFYMRVEHWFGVSLQWP